MCFKHASELLVPWCVQESKKIIKSWVTKTVSWIVRDARACVRAFVSKQNMMKNSCKNQEKQYCIAPTAHTRRIIRTPSLFPATGLTIPDDDPTRLPAPAPRAIDSRAPPPVAVATDARRATIPLLPTRDVGGRRPEGRGPAPAPTPPATNEALDALASDADLLC